ncbi:MAG: rhodanese-like domain-containing protein [Chitinophagaceae bacterium]|nr:rhodanese-like domain-containing protein [Chitinophagaceae bacterium]MBK8952364.1 rhodanese-like domain-containing protein [Chitinophagaceae bacterium]
MGLLAFFGFGKNKLIEALAKGAVVVDVRTANEFDRGKVPDSVNVPLERIAANTERIKNYKRPVVCVCTSGSRSGQAVKLLKSAGIKEVYNGGNWINLLELLRNL